MSIDFNYVCNKLNSIFEENKKECDDNLVNIKKTYDIVEKELENIMYADGETYQKSISFLQSNSQIWGRALFLAEFINDYLFECYKSFCLNHLLKLSEKDLEDLNNYLVCFKALIYKTNNVFKSILCLAKSGYVESAFALWRSLYELEIIAKVLNKGESVAIDSFYKHLNSLSDDNYEWARFIPSFKVRFKTVSFADLVSYMSLFNSDGYREYKMACKVIHISRENLTSVLGNYTPEIVSEIVDRNILQSTIGIDIILNHIILSMSSIYELFFSKFISEDNNYILLSSFFYYIKSKVLEEISLLNKTNSVAIIYH